MMHFVREGDFGAITRGRCSAVEDLPRGARITNVDGVPCYGQCKECRKPIVEGDKFFGAFRLFTCEDCEQKKKKQN